MADPFGDPDHLAVRLFDQHPDAGRPRATMGTAVDICHQICHQLLSIYLLRRTMRHLGLCRQGLIWFCRHLRPSPLGHLVLWKPLWKSWKCLRVPFATRIFPAFFNAALTRKKSAFAQITGVDNSHSSIRMAHVDGRKG